VRATHGRKVNGFAGGLLYSEDWLFFLRLSVMTPLYFMETATYRLRRQRESLTTNSRRLTLARAAGHKAAMADPLLRPFRRELRWALYSTYKGIAANNLLAGQRARAAAFATRAYLLDPRALRDALRFLRLTRITSPQDLRVAIPA
jgi:hypothetical protein